MAGLSLSTVLSLPLSTVFYLFFFFTRRTTCFWVGLHSEDSCLGVYHTVSFFISIIAVVVPFWDRTRERGSVWACLDVCTSVHLVHFIKAEI